MLEEARAKTDSARAAAVRHAVLVALLDDQARGVVRARDGYRRLFPGFEPEVEAALQAVLDDEGSLATAQGLPTERIGRYRLLSELGRGAQGVVYAAEDEALARRVALKVLAPRFALAPLAEARFRREAVAASRLTHPGLCAVHDVGEVGGLPYLAMELLEGETLAGRLTRAGGQLPDGAELRARVRLVEEAARAMDAVHACGVLHRDLKPSNLFVRVSGEPVVLDFGLSHDEGQPVSLTLSGDVFGTPAYMAPEQIEGRRSAVGPATDVYALGVVLYECLTGDRPFRAPTRRGLYHAILVADPVSPRVRNPRVSVELALVTLKALAKEPVNRYASAGELADELQRVREHRPVRARPAGPLLRLRRWCRRDPWLAASALGLVGTLLCGWIVTGVLARRTKASELELLRHGDRRHAEELEHSMEELWPVLPEGIPAMDAWLAETEALRLRWPDVTRADPAMRSLLERLPARIDEVRARRESARAIPEQSIERHRAAWNEAIDAIADRDRSPAYAGLQIAPQVGLVPIGKDPLSGLFEFAHLQTGSIPERDVRGHLIVTEDMGLVFVLLPGGWFTMGSCALSSVHAAIHEQDIQLGPFFLSKYEMTQGQWLRVRGTNPSEYAPREIGWRGLEYRNPFGLSFDLRHPVERVSRSDCAETARCLGLTIPTSAQWEYAARAGTQTCFWPGTDDSCLLGVANVYDRSRALASDPVEGLEFDDGYCFHAPVGSFAANPFGLHDVHGNVWEWVRERFGSDELPVRGGDGERLAAEGPFLVRGGSFGDTANFAKLVVSHPVPRETELYSNRGFRPARELRAARAEDGP